MKKITDYITLIKGDPVKWVNDFMKSDTEDKNCMIADLFGIYDSSINGNVFTYYFWYSDVCIGNIFNYYGKSRDRKWRKLIHCKKVDYNFDSDVITITHTRFNKRCIENQGRSL